MLLFNDVTELVHIAHLRTELRSQTTFIYEILCNNNLRYWQQYLRSFFSEFEVTVLLLLNSTTTLYLVFILITLLL